MSARPAPGSACGRALGSLRVVGSFVAAAVVGSLLLVPVIGPLAGVAPLGVLVLGFPALVVAIAVRLVFARSIDAHLLAWCLAAPLVAVAAHFAAQYFLDYRQRGFGLADFLSLPQNPSQAQPALFYASAASAIFYVWERRSGARRGA